MSTVHRNGICPHLGLDDDPASWETVATSRHVCYRWPDRSKAIDEDHQRAFCLSEDFRDCYRLVTPEEEPVAPVASSGGGRGRVLTAVLVVVVVAVVAVSAGVVTGQLPGLVAAGQSIIGGGNPVVAEPTLAPTSLPVAAPTGTPTPTETPVPTETPTSTPAPPTSTATPEPSRTPEASPTAEAPPTVEATPAPESPTPGPRIHQVTRGETLGQLSRQYGIPVEAIARANGLQANPNLILTGQTLIIP